MNYFYSRARVVQGLKYKVGEGGGEGGGEEGGFSSTACLVQQFWPGRGL